MIETRSYPRNVKTDAGDIELRLMTRSDEASVLAFAQKLPTHDLYSCRAISPSQK
jgi:hypothetical protein